jgi:hypothetical protein
VAWFAYLGLSTTEMGPDILLLIASFIAGVVLATAICWGLAMKSPIAITAIVPIGGFAPRNSSSATRKGHAA